MPDRVALFIDWQNVYRSARRAFYDPSARIRPSDGQIDPVAVAELLCQRGVLGANRELVDVRVYSGRPNPDYDPKTHRAHMQQCAVWEQAGAKVITKPLQYLEGEPPREKGVDVQIAMDILIGAYERTYDVGILFSADTDLLPPLQFVVSSNQVSARVEAAAWRSSRHQSRLSLPEPYRLWCHYLRYEDYQLVRDPTPYARRR